MALRTKAGHYFTVYKVGTVWDRRIAEEDQLGIAQVKAMKASAGKSVVEVNEHDRSGRILWSALYSRGRRMVQA